jgi:beta-glucosidase
MRHLRLVAPAALGAFGLLVLATVCSHPSTGTTSGAGGSSSPGTGGSGNGGGGGPGQGGSTGNGGQGGGGGGVSTMGCETVLPASGAGGAGTAMACGSGAPSGSTCNLGYTAGYTPDSNVQSAVQTLVNSMSDAEKAQQMRGLTVTTNNYNVFRQDDNTSRGIKAFYFRDGPRGVNLNANADSKPDHSTAFPVAMARGAAFDVDLEYQVGQAVGDEMLASGNTMMLAPTVNILRHAAWGRAQETYGEDPFLLGRLGSAFVTGVQEYAGACAKHYAGNNVENGRASADAEMDEQTLREIYARHFEMIIRDGGVSCIMASYNLVNGTKSTQNAHLLTDLLRKDFQFKGFVLSDWWAMPNGNAIGNITNSTQAPMMRSAATAAVNAGLDMELPWSYNYSFLESLVQGGSLMPAQLTSSASRILEQKKRFKVDAINGTLGLKKPTTTYDGNTASIGNDQSHIDLALKAAIESMVLLKNDQNALPIDRTAAHTVALVGAKVTYTFASTNGPDPGNMIDFKTNVRTGDVGSSRVFPDPNKSIGPLAGIQAAAGSGITINQASTTADLATALSNADVAVVIAGLTPQDEGEEYTGAGDRHSFALDAKQSAANMNVQNTLIMQTAMMMTARGKPTVVVLEGGSVIDMPWLPSVQAVVMAWYPGMVGGQALGKLLFGDENFGGKLPISWPKQFADGPMFPTGANPNQMTGLTVMMDYYIGYRWFDHMVGTVAPLFPFGAGLSYTTFQYSNLFVPCTTVAKDGVVNVQVDVKNAGTRKGDEVVFLFVSYPSTQARRPTKELKGFYRVTLDAGQSKRITIPLRVGDLKYWDMTQNTWIVESGPVEVMVGGNSTTFAQTGMFNVN